MNKIINKLDSSSTMLKQNNEKCSTNVSGTNEATSSSSSSSSISKGKTPDFSKLPSAYDSDLVKPSSQYKLEPKMDLIIPRLYLSDDIAARNIKLLTKYNITHILNLTTNIPNKFEPNIMYKKLVILDFESQNISQYFAEANEFIDNALAENDKNCVLVHCNAGISRSSSFVIAYLMHKKMFKSYKDALKFVRKKRPIVSPNKGFEKQLINLEVKLKKKNNCNIM